MTHVITGSCCNDAVCAQVCPVDCIHPTPDEPGYGNAEMLYINPLECVDCEACVEVCPVDAIYKDRELPAQLSIFSRLNALHFIDTVPAR